MSNKDKLRDRFLTAPKDFTFDEVEKLLSGYGYVKDNKGKTSGSRVVFKNGDNRPIMLHKPHPDNIVKSYALRQIFDDLREAGFMSDTNKTEEEGHK